VADIYVYADETGNFDYDVRNKQGASEYFGFGTAVFARTHGMDIWSGLELRTRLAAGEDGRPGVSLPRGFHAKDDSTATRVAMFEEIARQAPRFDSTFLLKRRAISRFRKRGEMYLYKYAWYEHFSRLAPQVSGPGDRLVVVVASLGTKARQTEAREALDDVCRQTGRTYVLCVWDAATSWGLQVADYGLWAMQRALEWRSGTWYHQYVRPSTASHETPWGFLPRPQAEK
jgi:hypothetical protein